MSIPTISSSKQGETFIDNENPYRGVIEENRKIQEIWNKKKKENAGLTSALECLTLNILAVAPPGKDIFGKKLSEKTAKSFTEGFNEYLSIHQIPSNSLEKLENFFIHLRYFFSSNPDILSAVLEESVDINVEICESISSLCISLPYWLDRLLQTSSSKKFLFYSQKYSFFEKVKVVLPLDIPISFEKIKNSAFLFEAIKAVIQDKRNIFYHCKTVEELYVTARLFLYFSPDFSPEVCRVSLRIIESSLDRFSDDILYVLSLGLHSKKSQFLESIIENFKLIVQLKCIEGDKKIILQKILKKLFFGEAVGTKDFSFFIPLFHSFIEDPAFVYRVATIFPNLKFSPCYFFPNQLSLKIGLENITLEEIPKCFPYRKDYFCSHVVKIDFSRWMGREGDRKISAKELVSLLKLCSHLVELSLSGKEIIFEEEILLEKDFSLPLLKKIDFAHAVIPKELLELFIKIAPNVENLSFKGIHFREELEEGIDIYCKHLKVLNLNETVVSNNFLKKIIENSPCIEEIGLYRSRCLVEEGFCLEKTLPFLRWVQLSFSSVQGKNLIEILKKTPHLQFLALAQCKNLDSLEEKDFEKVSLFFLEKLSLHSSSITEGGVKGFLNVAPSLRKVSLEGCLKEEMSIKPLQQLSNQPVNQEKNVIKKEREIGSLFKSSPYLTSSNTQEHGLSFFLKKFSNEEALFLHSFQEEDFIDVEEIEFPYLKNLDLSELKIPRKGLEKLIKGMPFLKKLSLTDCICRSFDVYLPSLEALQIDSTLFEAKVIDKILENTPQLKVLCLSDIGEDIDNFPDLKKVCPNLKTLFLRKEKWDSVFLERIYLLIPKTVEVVIAPLTTAGFTLEEREIIEKFWPKIEPIFTSQ